MTSVWFFGSFHSIQVRQIADWVLGIRKVTTTQSELGTISNLSEYSTLSLQHEILENLLRAMVSKGSWTWKS